MSASESPKAPPASRRARRRRPERPCAVPCRRDRRSGRSPARRRSRSASRAPSHHDRGGRRSVPGRAGRCRSPARCWRRRRRAPRSRRAPPGGAVGHRSSVHHVLGHLVEDAPRAGRSGSRARSRIHRSRNDWRSTSPIAHQRQGRNPRPEEPAIPAPAAMLLEPAADATPRLAGRAGSLEVRGDDARPLRRARIGAAGIGGAGRGDAKLVHGRTLDARAGSGAMPITLEAGRVSGRTRLGGVGRTVPASAGQSRVGRAVPRRPGSPASAGQSRVGRTVLRRPRGALGAAPGPSACRIARRDGRGPGRRRRLRVDGVGSDRLDMRRDARRCRSAGTRGTTTRWPRGRPATGARPRSPTPGRRPAPPRRWPPRRRAAGRS